MNARWVSYHHSNLLGRYADPIHPSNGFGFYDYAAAIVGRMLAA